MTPKNFTTTISIQAPSALVASHKKTALEKLASAFSAKELKALAEQGPDFVNHPDFGPMIRRELGL